VRLTVAVAVQSDGHAGGVMFNRRAGGRCPFLLLRTCVRKETTSAKGEKSISKCQSTKLNIYRHNTKSERFISISQLRLLNTISFIYSDYVITQHMPGNQANMYMQWLVVYLQ
jgi:hypothetical protein